ncbi:S-layer homology domain-containing protein [Leucobacter sp. NPDC058333]|uniref:S-layer homology domain-containing protein n=1 Tax=Leucobacter sp. NPDC058333 TaxID=3346450 RepID=UPI00364687AD
MKCALVLGLSLGLLGQGSIAYATPGPTTPPVTTADAAADSNGSADAGGSAGADAANATADATAGANGVDGGTSSAASADASANASADASAGTSVDATADASGTVAADGGEASTGVQGASADASVEGAASADGVDAEATSDASGPGTDADASADPVDETPATEEPGKLTPTKLPDSAIDESLGRERALRAPAASTSLSSGFNAGYIISDENFYNGSAMSASQVQSFLNQKIGRCTIGDPGREPGKPIFGSVVAQKCLSNSTHDSISRGANAYCKAFAGKQSESAASIITRVAKACNVSPRVLLIMLEKEQSLVSDTWPTARQFSVAMGYACPDSGPGNSANCNSKYFGFANQVYYGAWQLQVYKAHPNDYNYKPFRTNTIQWHPNAGCGTSQVYIENWATAALYIYTPYRPNAAALNAGWGEGDGCSSYGNRNFYQFYKSWFGSPNTRFPDVPASHQFYKEIEWMGATGLTTGTKTADGRVVFQPKSAVTREAMAAFLYRLEGATYKGPKTSPFADLKPGDKFYKEITWMYAKGYSTGFKQSAGKPKYLPKSVVSREATAAFIYRIKGGKYVGPAASPFADMRRGDKFYNEVTWMYARGYTTGIKQGSTKIYAPKSSMTREAMAAFIYRVAH